MVRGVPRRAGGRPLVLRVSEIGGEVVRFLSRSDQVFGRHKRSPMGGKQPPIGVCHSNIVQRHRIANNSSVRDDFSLILSRAKIRSRPLTQSLH
jgi:hypothetical protein